ncbi:MAG: hypothetical protein ACYS91_06795 [Planctomycetota bacterium]
MSSSRWGTNTIWLVCAEDRDMGDMIATVAIENLSGSLGRIDILIITVAVLLLFVISYVFGREEKDTNDFVFLLPLPR